MQIKRLRLSVARKIRGAFSNTVFPFSPRPPRVSPARTTHEYPRLPYGTDQTISIAPPVAILLQEPNALSYHVDLQRWNGTNWVTIQQIRDHPIPIVLFDQANTPSLYRWSYKPYRSQLSGRYTWSSWIEFEITSNTPTCQVQKWSEIVADFSTRARPVLLSQGDNLAALRNRVNARTPNSPADHLYFDSTRLLKVHLTGDANGSYNSIALLGSSGDNYNLSVSAIIGYAAMMAWFAAVEDNPTLAEKAWQWGYYWLNEHHKYLNNQPNRFSASAWSDSYNQSFSTEFLALWWDYIQSTGYSIPSEERGVAIQRIFNFWNWRINQANDSWFKWRNSFEERIASPFHSHQMRHWYSMLVLGLAILKDNPPPSIKHQIEATYYRVYGIMPVWCSNPQTGEILKGYSEGYDYLLNYAQIMSRLAWVMEKIIGNIGFSGNRRICNSLEYLLHFDDEPLLGHGDRSVWINLSSFTNRPMVIYYIALPLMYANGHPSVKRLAYHLRGKIHRLASMNGVMKASRDSNTIGIGNLSASYDTPSACLSTLQSVFSPNTSVPQDWVSEPDNTYLYNETTIPKSAHVPAVGVIARNYALNSQNGVRVDLRASPFHIASHSSKDSPLSVIVQAYGNRFIENGAYRRSGVDNPFHDQYELTAASSSCLWVGVHQSGVFTPIKNTFRYRGSVEHEILPASTSKFYEGTWNGYNYVYFEGDATQAFVHLDAEMHHAKRRCVLLDFAAPIVVILDEVQPKQSNRGFITNWHTRFAPIQHSPSRYSLFGSIFWRYETSSYQGDLSASESNWNGDWYNHLRPTVKAAARFGILGESTINIYSFVARGFGNDPSDVQTVPASWSTNPYIVWNTNGTPRGVNYNQDIHSTPPSYLRHLVVYSNPLPTTEISRFGYAIVPFRLREATTNAPITSAFADNEWIFARSDVRNPTEVQIGVFNNAPSAKYGVIVKFKKSGYTESNAVSFEYIPDEPTWNNFSMLQPE